jgi:hypothetical protein
VSGCLEHKFYKEQGISSVGEVRLLCGVRYFIGGPVTALS